ncbi:hem-containing dehydratase protein [Aspergillus spinulosporus]
MWGLKLPANIPIVLAVFGIQRLEANSANLLIEAFNALFTTSAPTIEHLEQDDPTPTHLWLTYWPSKAAFETWWNSEPVSSFWSSLPDDAGVYREIMTVPPGRTQHGTNAAERVNGMASLGILEDVSKKSGYWGCYYDRMADVTREKRNEIRSTAAKTPSRSSSALAGDKILRGRVRLNAGDLPDHIAFVVEGQDHSLITPEERSHWFEHFDAPVKRWIMDLVAAGPEHGVLNARLCYEPAGGIYRDTDAAPSALNYNRKVELFYFQDMEAMERIGRQNKGHVNLRREFMASYAPDGPMGRLPGKLCLWVEASILKGEEIEAEYVGCVKGTGLMELSWE